MLPVSNWIDRARRNRCRTLICNGMENQPRVTAEHRILAEFPQAVVEGLRILARLTAARETFLAVDRRRTGDYRGLVESARRHDIERVALTHKYPTGADAVLVKVLTRREVMFAGVPIGQHIAVTEPATCLAVYRQVVCGQAPVGRVVTVIGGGDLPAGNYYLPFGTVVSDIIPHGAIHGGPMSGLRCDESAVVTPGTDALLKLQADEQFAPGPCIRCGWCTGHCPARLNVAMMNDHFELGEVLQARRDGVFACVECGICTYVCPAGLPLSQRMRKLKWALRRTRRNTREQA
jgi:electron transport complex protein RnfC